MFKDPRQHTHGLACELRHKEGLTYMRSFSRPIIRTFAASGRLLGSHVWDKGRIVAWGWSAALELIVVEESGRVVVLSLFGERMREFSMGAVVDKGGVSQVKSSKVHYSALCSPS